MQSIKTNFTELMSYLCLKNVAQAVPATLIITYCILFIISLS